MKITIITPTILRSTLQKTIDSIDMQTHTDWQHLIMVDSDTKERYENTQNRQYIYLDKSYNNYGNTPRYLAWDYIEGDYIVYLDDDDFYIDKNLFEDALNTIGDNVWILWPCIRFNERFFNLPPLPGRTVTCQYMHKKIAPDGNELRWPSKPIKDEYGVDADFLNILNKYGYATLHKSIYSQVNYVNRGKWI